MSRLDVIPSSVDRRARYRYRPVSVAVVVSLLALLVPGPSGASERAWPPGPPTLGLATAGHDFGRTAFYGDADSFRAAVLWLEGEWSDGAERHARFTLDGTVSTSTEADARRISFDCEVVSARSDGTDLANCRSPEFGFYTGGPSEHSLHVADGDTVTATVTHLGRTLTVSARWWEMSRPITAEFVRYDREAPTGPTLRSDVSPMSWGSTGAYGEGDVIRVFDAASSGNLLDEVSAGPHGAFEMVLPADAPGTVWVERTSAADEMVSPQYRLGPSPRVRIDAATASTPPAVADFEISGGDGWLVVHTPVGTVPRITVLTLYRGAGDERQQLGQWPYFDPDQSRYDESFQVGGDLSDLYLTATTYGPAGVMLESRPVALDITSGAQGEFSDTGGHPHESGIEAIVEAGITSGYSDGTFRPNGVVTRGQMATFLMRALELAASGSGAGFSDTGGHPHESGIEAIVEAGITSGYSDGTFRPNAVVTRGQMATFLMRALGL